MNKTQIIIYGRGDKVPSDYFKINVTSKSKELWSRNFSPFYLGPVKIKPYMDQTYECKIFENAWQYLKRYSSQNESEWLEWAKNGWKLDKARRFPMGRGAKPLFAYWKGRELGYIEARFKIYGKLIKYLYYLLKNGEIMKGRQAINILCNQL